MDLMSLMVKVGANITGAIKGLSEVENKMSGTAKKASSFADKLKSGFSAVKTGALAMGVGFTAAAATVTKLATSAAATTDHIDKMSQKVGLSRKAYQEMDFIMSQSGGSVDSLAAGMKTLRTSMTAAQSGTEANVKQFKALGVAVTDAKGNLRGTEDVMFDTIAALQKIPNETERAAKATQLFGKAGTELIPLLNSGAGSIEEMRQKANELGLVLGDDAIDAGVKLTDTIDQVKRSFSSITTKIGVSVMPMVQSVLDVVLDNMPVIQKVMTAVFSVIGKVVGGAVKLFGGLVKGIGNVARAVGGKLKPVLQTIGGIPKLIGQVFKGDLDIPSMLANLLTGGRVTWVANYNIPRFLDQFVKPALKSGLEKLFGDGSAAESIINGFSKMIYAVTGVVNTLEEAFEPTIAAIKEFAGTVSGLFSGNSSLADVGASLVNIFKAAWTGVASIDWAKLGTTIWNAIKAAFSAVVEWYKTLFTSAGDIIKKIDWAGLGATIWSWIKSGFNAIGDWIKQLVLGDNYTPDSSWADVGGKIWGAIKDGFNAVNGWLLKLVLGDDYTPEAGWRTVGEKIWKDIKNGFNAVKGWLFQLVLGDSYTPESTWGDVGGKIWSTIKTGFGIASDWLLKLLLGDGYTPESDWGTVGENIWGAIKTGFAIASDWLLKLLLGDGYTPESDWGTVGADIWNSIKSGFTTAGDWIKGLVLGDEYTPDASWSDVGGKIWLKITEGLSSAVDWLKGLLDGWTAKLTDGSVDFTSIGASMWTAISSAFSGVVTWFKNLFGGKNDTDTKSVKGAITADIDWAGLGTSILGFITGAFTGIGDIFKGFFDGVWTSISEIDWAGLGNTMWEAIKNAFSAVSQWFKDTFKKPINAVIGFLNDMIGKVESAVNTIVDGINSHLHITIPNVSWSWDFVHGNGGFKTDYRNPFMDWNPRISRVSLSRIQTLAKGGTVMNGGQAIVGEAGAEYLRVVNGQAVVTPIKGMNGGGDTYNTINIYQQPGQDPRELAEIVQRELVRIGRQQKAVYA